jgi:hypothetical protein
MTAEQWNTRHPPPEHDLAALRAECARWQIVAETASLEREHNANVAGELRAENARLREELTNLSEQRDCLHRERDRLRAELKAAAQSTPARVALKADCYTMPATAHCLSCAYFDLARSWCVAHEGRTTPDYLCKDFAPASALRREP